MADRSIWLANGGQHAVSGAPHLKQAELPVLVGVRPARWHELAAIKAGKCLREAEATAGEIEALAQQFGKMAEPGHSAAKAGIVGALATQVVKH